MVHGPSRSLRGLSLARRMRLDCVGDADLAETSERGADPLRAGAPSPSRHTPKAFGLVVLRSSPSHPSFSLFQIVGACRARWALAAQKAQWAAAFAELAEEEVGRDAPTPRII